MLKKAEKYLKLLDGQYYKCFGKVAKVVGLTIESVGPEARLNDMCMIYLDADRTEFVMAEVVGFRVHGCTRIVGRILWKIAFGDAQICELGLLGGIQSFVSPQVESVFHVFGYGQLECEASDGC